MYSLVVLNINIHIVDNQSLELFSLNETLYPLNNNTFLPTSQPLPTIILFFFLYGFDYLTYLIKVGSYCSVLIF
jgi:hypothetical protein